MLSTDLLKDFSPTSAAAYVAPSRSRTYAIGRSNSKKVLCVQIIISFKFLVFQLIFSLSVL